MVQKSGTKSNPNGLKDPTLPTNLYRTPSGYVFRKVVPKPLQGILNKTEIKVPCGKTYADALANYPVEAVRAQQAISEARAKLQAEKEAVGASRLRLAAPMANLKPITSVTPELIEQLRGLWLSGLDNDLAERSQGLGDEDFESLSSNVAEMQATLANAMARGKVEIVLPALHQLLFLRGYVLALNPTEERTLAYDFLQAVAAYCWIVYRSTGQRTLSDQSPDGRPEGVKD